MDFLQYPIHAGVLLVRLPGSYASVSKSLFRTMSICSASLYSFHAIQAACKPASKSFSQLSNHSAWFLNCTTTSLRITESGSAEEVGAGKFPPSHNSPPEILKLSMVIIVLSQVLNNNLVSDCIRSNLSGSKFKIFLGQHAPTPP